MKMKLTDKDLCFLYCYINGIGTKKERDKGQEIQERVLRSLRTEMEGRLALEISKAIFGGGDNDG